MGTKYEESKMKELEGKPLYIVKYKDGNAYYFVNASAFALATPFETISIVHLLSFQEFKAPVKNLIKVDFEDMPECYKRDALALNPLARRVFGNNYTHTQSKFEMDKKCIDRFFDKVGPSLVNTLKKEFKSYDTSGSLRAAASELPLAQSNNITKQKENSFMGLNIPGLNLSFGQIEKGLIAIDMQGNPAFRDKSGNYVSVVTDESGNKKQLSVGDLKVDLPFYTIPTQELEVDDIVLIDGRLLIVSEKPKTGGFKFVDPITGSVTNKLERTNILNFYFYSKVVSIFNMGNESGPKGFGLGNMNPLTMALLMGDGGIGGNDSLADYLVLSQLATGGKSDGGFNPMMLMLLNKDKNTSSMLPLLMMMGGNIFGAPAKAKKAAKPAAKTSKAKSSKKGAVVRTIHKV